jgi:hypothetical protein
VAQPARRKRHYSQPPFSNILASSVIGIAEALPVLENGTTRSRRAGPLNAVTQARSGHIATVLRCSSTHPKRLDRIDADCASRRSSHRKQSHDDHQRGGRRDDARMLRPPTSATAREA